MASDLTPCPFCGGAAFCHDFRGGAGYWQVECQDCDATTDGRKIKSEAIDIWNRRSYPAAPAEPVAAEAQKAVAWQVKQKVYKDRAPWVDVDQTTYESAAKYPNKCEVRALGVIGPSASAAAQSAPIERWWRLLLGYGWQNGWDTTSMCLAVADEMRAFAEKNGIRLAAQPGEAE